jgi:hypothetical protein
MSFPVPPTSRTTQLALLCGAVSVGVALKIANGNFSSISVALLFLAILAVLHAVAGKPIAILERLSPRHVTLLTLIGAGVFLLFLLLPPMLPPSVAANADVRIVPLLRDCGFVVPDPPDSGTPIMPLLVGCAIFGVTSVLLALRSGRLARLLSAAAIACALLLHFCGNLAAIGAAPAPASDVLVFQSAGLASLMLGGNPYAVTFPDVAGDSAGHYPPELAANGQLLFGFPYPPLSLFWLVPAWFAGSLVQSMHAIAFTLSAALIAFTSRESLAKAAALLLMLMPVGPLVICSGWTEPLVALMLALTVLIACRKPQWTGGGLGLFWAAKQYVPLLSPLSLLLVERESWRKQWPRLIAGALIVGAIVTLPMALWDLPAFWHSTVDVQLRQPFRPDAMSLLAAAHHAFGVTPPAWIAFVALAMVQALCLWRSPRTPAGFAAATAASLLVFFAFNKQAFANYYFLVVAVCACALAASGVQDSEPVDKHGKVARKVGTARR